MGKLKKPPMTKRYCMVCGKETYFEYDNVIGHSRCIECGVTSKSSIRINNPIKKHFEDKYSSLIIEVNKLKGKIKRQRDMLNKLHARYNKDDIN